MRRTVSLTHEARMRIFSTAGVALALSVLFLPFPSPSQAQVPPITPSGLNTQVTLAATPLIGKVQYDITGGTRPGGGVNLFQSFGEFGVPANNIANFLNDSGLATSNILGRVTGGNISNIFGTIRTTGFVGANLFLMNPAGFLFGPKATVNVGGMVAFTSADYLRLADGAIFNTTPNPTADALLSAAPVAAFGFLGSNPGAIAVQGSQFITVTEGTGISLVGGDITIEAGTLASGMVQPAVLSAPAGSVHLASVASPGEILAGNLDQAPNINGQSFGALRTIQVSQQSVIDVSGDGRGTVLIRGGRFVLEESEILANVFGSATTVAGEGIDVEVNKDITVVDSVMESFTETAESGGSIRLKAKNDIVVEVSSIETGTEEGSGHAGNIALTSTNGNIVMTDGLVGSSSFDGSGNSGDIELTSLGGDISVGVTSIVTSQTILSDGNAGVLRVNAPEGDILLTGNSQLFNSTRGAGSLGELRITGRNLTVSDSGITGDNFSTQVPDNISIDLSETLTLSGGPNVSSFIRTISRGSASAGDLSIIAKDIQISEQGLLSTEAFSSGHGGHLNLSTETLQLTTGGQVKSGSTISSPPPGQPPITPSGAGGIVTIQGHTGPADSIVIDGLGSGIFANTEGTGAGGNMFLSAHSLTMQNGATISASTKGLAPSATGGSITVNTTDHVTMASGASITASSTDPGNANAGDISINAGQRLEMRDSSITTESAKASGGNIDIQAVDRVRLVNSPISTSVPNGTGNGGNITIDPNVIVLQNSDIIAKAVQGAGGNITLTTPLFLADSTSLVDASSQFGVNGRVTIQSPTSNLSESLGTLPSKPSQAQALLTQRCAALANGQTSSLVVAGREQLPEDPGGWLTSPLAFTALSENLDTDHAVTSAPAVIAMTTHDAGTISLRRLTPVGFLMANFADSEATGCHS